MTPKIQIRTLNAKSAGEKLLSVVEENLTPDDVSIDHIPIAVKSLDPVEIFITAVSTLALEEFLLKPLIGPLAEKWQVQVKQFFSPYHSFSIEISFQDTKRKIVTDPPMTSLHGMIQVWSAIGAANKIVISSGLDIDLLRIISEGDDALYALAYKDKKKPLWKIDIHSQKILSLPQ